MHRLRFVSVLVLLLVISTTTASTTSAQTLPPPDPGIALVPSMVDSLGDDADGDRQISCGDQVTFVVDFGSTTTSEDLDFRDVLLEISVPTSIATLVGGSLAAFNPDDIPQILSGSSASDDRIAVHMGRVCRTPTCNSPAATVSFSLQILDPNLFTSLALQGIVTGSNTPNSVTDDPDTSEPVDATVTTFLACPPRPLLSAQLRDALAADRDGDGLADPGDVLLFTHVVTNSPAADTEASNLVYTLPTSTGLEILPTTAQVSVGSITSATSSDVRVFIPSLAPGRLSKLTFEARIEAPTDLVRTTAQFRLSGLNFPAFLSDDPDTSLAGDPTRTLIDRDPDLALDLSVTPTAARPGTELTYTAAVTNLGSLSPPAQGTVLSVTVPSSTRLVSAVSDPVTCSPDTTAGSTCEFLLGTVASGDSVVRSFTLAIDSSVPPTFAGVVTTATVSDDGSQGPDPDPSNNTDTAEALADPATVGPDLELDKDDGGATATPGEPVSYDVHWENLGNQDATGVVLEDVVPGHAAFEPASSTSGWSCTPDGSAGSTCRISLGSVPVGDAGTVRFAVRVASQVPAGVVSITNTATIAHDGTANEDLNPSDNTDTEITPLAASVGPDLSLDKVAQTGTAVPGETLSYILTVANHGTRGATGVRLVEAIPPHTAFVASQSDPGWSCTTEACALDLPSLPAGAEEAFVFAVRVDSSLPAGITSIANSAVVRDDGTNGDDLDPTDNEDTEDVPLDPTVSPDLGVLKTARVAAVSPGELLVFDVTVTNSGNQAATGVTLTETVPSETSFVASASDPGWDCADQAPAGTVCTLFVSELAAGQADVFPFAVRVSQALPAGVLVVSNTVRVDDDGANGDDPNPEDDSDTENVPVDGAAPDVSVEKSSRNLTVRPGDLLTYTILYRNEGTREATQVRLLETVPEDTTFVAADSDPGWSCAGTEAGSSCELPVGSLPVGTSETSLFTVRVDPELPAGVSSIGNSVAIVHDPGDGDDPDPGDEDDTEDTPIDPSAGPDLGVTKTDSGVIVRPGESVTYDLQITNRGSRGASGVVVTETLPDDTRLVDPTDAPSNAPWQCLSGTCTLELGELAVGSGASLGLTVRVDPAVPDGITAVVNTARVQDDGTNGADPDLSNNSAVESTPLDTAPEGGQTGPDLGLTKSDGGRVVSPGGEIVYQLTLRNDGTEPASGVVLEETVPEHTVFLGSLSTPGWSCPDGAAGGTPCRLEVAALLPGDVQGLRFAVRLPEDTAPAPARVTNTASVTDDGTNGDDLDPTNNTDAETTPVRLPDRRRELETTLDDLITTDRDGDERADVDDVLTYVTEITNHGSTAETGVELVIEPDPHTQLLGGSVMVDLPAEIVHGGEFRDAHVEVVLERLAPGETAEIVFLAQVTGLPTAVRHLSVQGEVSVGALRLLTDDPMTPAPDDPTRTPTDAATFEPVDVPTLGQLALMLLAAMLAAVAVIALRS